MLVPTVQSARRSVRPIPRWLVPSLSDCLFLAILLWVFAAGSGWSVLLADGDTGWHIRTGEYILDTRSVPVHDLFSFSKAGQPWFAWEWLADVIFALLHREWGLKGVVAFSGVVLALSATLLFRSIVSRGANLLAALAATLLAAGASTVHYLARPHIFTLLGLTAGLWMLDRDRRKHGRAVWWLVPLTALWTNLHGGVFAWLACLGLVAAGCAGRAALEPPGASERFREVRRYAFLGGACALATLANPYGWRLHQHVAAYLRSDWIRSVVDEFQSPRFRSESMLQFEILLLAGVALVAVLLKRREFPEALLILFWAHAALGSARHVPLYAIAAAPVCAAEASRLWSAWTAGFGRKSVAGTLRDCLRDFSAIPQHWSAWAPVVLACLAGVPWEGPQDFPGNKFPVVAFQRNRAVFEPASQPRRILTSDQWGDYLIYHLYPRVRVFVDGRSDFYGQEVGREYLALLNGAGDWERIADRYRFDVALLPVEWPLGQLLQRDARWRVLYLDQQAIVLERTSETGLNPKADSAERILGDEPSELEGTSAPKIRGTSRKAEVQLPLRPVEGHVAAAFGPEIGGICSGIRVSCAPVDGKPPGAGRGGEEIAMTVLALISFAVGIAAVVEDLARRQISNWTSGAALALGLAVHVSRNGWRGAAAAGEGAALGFAIFLVFYLLRGMGGGDVKLMAGFGSLVGPSAILCAAWIAAVAGGLMATGYAAVRAARRRQGNIPREARREADAIPYAPAIVAGVWLAELAMG